MNFLRSRARGTKLQLSGHIMWMWSRIKFVENNEYNKRNARVVWRWRLGRHTTAPHRCSAPRRPTTLRRLVVGAAACWHAAGMQRVARGHSGTMVAWITRQTGTAAWTYRYIIEALSPCVRRWTRTLVLIFPSFLRTREGASVVSIVFVVFRGLFRARAAGAVQAARARPTTDCPQTLLPHLIFDHQTYYHMHWILIDVNYQG